MFDRLSDIARFQPWKSYYVCSPCTSFAVNWLNSDSNLGNSDLGTVVALCSLHEVLIIRCNNGSTYQSLHLVGNFRLLILFQINILVFNKNYSRSAHVDFPC